MSLVSDLAAICNVTPEQAVRMVAVLEGIGGAPMFMGTPDRWYEDLHYRCENGHVSSYVLLCEEGPRHQCLAAGCRARCFVTFPEDVEDDPINLGPRRFERVLDDVPHVVIEQGRRDIDNAYIAAQPPIIGRRDVP